MRKHNLAVLRSVGIIGLYLSRGGISGTPRAHSWLEFAASEQHRVRARRGISARVNRPPLDRRDDDRYFTIRKYRRSHRFPPQLASRRSSPNRLRPNFVRARLSSIAGRNFKSGGKRESARMKRRSVSLEI